MTDTRRGIILMLIASFFFALTMVFAKILSSSMGSVEVTFWRNLIGLILVLALVWRKPIKNVGGRPITLVFRGVIGTVALLAFFYTISATSLSHAIVYGKTEPIFTALLAFILLGEKLTLRSITAVIIGFLGVCVLSGLEFSYLNIMGILVGFLSALAYTSVRSLKAYYDERTVVLSFMFFGVIIPALLMIGAEFYTSSHLAFALNPFLMPHGVSWLWILFMGIAAAYGQIYMTRAYFYAEAGLVSTISYSVVLFASFFGILLGDVLPTFMIVVGAILIVASGIILSRGKKG